MERYSDSESETSVLYLLSRDQIDEFDNGNLNNRRRNNEQSSIDQGFLDMKRQIGELNNLVLAMTKKSSLRIEKGTCCKPSLTLTTAVPTAESQEISLKLGTVYRTNLTRKVFCIRL